MGFRIISIVTISMFSYRDAQNECVSEKRVGVLGKKIHNARFRCWKKGSGISLSFAWDLMFVVSQQSHGSEHLQEGS